jgi:hypothetical protein
LHRHDVAIDGLQVLLPRISAQLRAAILKKEDAFLVKTAEEFAEHN